MIASLYEEHRAYVLAVLARRCGWLGADEHEAIFHDAYAVMLEKACDGRLELAEMHANQVRAYLTRTAIHKALDEGKRAERSRTEPIAELDPAEPELGPRADDAAAVRALVDELPRPCRAVIKLRFFLGRTPDEVQAILGLTPRAYRRELERGRRYVYERFERDRSRS